jgi:hypothetical protein
VAYLRIAEARRAAQSATSPLRKSAGQVLKEETGALRDSSTFDVFLSHSYDDAEVILGVKKIMESLGLKVYVDWIDDAGLDRGKVTRETAAILRLRMRNSLSLVYAHSESSGDSNWMPWELGYFDGFKPGCLWVLPIVAYYDSEFKSQEYLGLYPTVDKIADLYGRPNLGISNVGTGVNKRDIPLKEAASKSMSITYTG